MISKARKGEHKAQTLLYKNYRALWFSMCLRYNKNRDDALDALQNALINIFSNLDQFDSKKGSFKSWSTRIVVNENLMLLRKRSTEMNSVAMEEEIWHHWIEESSESSFSAQELMKMIQKLPQGYQAVFNLYVIEGYSHQEIAEILNVSIGTSKSQLFKAKKMLRSKLEVLI